MNREAQQYDFTDKEVILCIASAETLKQLCSEQLASMDRYALSYWSVVSGMLLWIAYLLYDELPAAESSNVLLGLAISMVLGALVIPIHEAIHGVTYWLIGAHDVRFSVQWRSGLFLTTAPCFLVKGVELVLILMAPWVTFLFSGIALHALGLIGLVEVLGFCLVQIAVSAGDFAIVFFMMKKGVHGILSYDDADGRSYFYLT